MARKYPHKYWALLCELHSWSALHKAPKALCALASAEEEAEESLVKLLNMTCEKEHGSGSHDRDPVNRNLVANWKAILQRIFFMSRIFYR